MQFFNISHLKAQLLKVILLVLGIIFFADNCFAAITYDWTGGSSTSWTTPGNWKVGGVTQVVNYPGSLSSTDIAQFGVNINFTTNQPTLSAALANNIASIVFGTNNGINITLTVTGVTLTVSGNMQQNYTTNKSVTTTLKGTGTIICSGDFVVGNNVAPASGSGNFANISSQITQMTINGNLMLYSVGNASNNGINYPSFYLDNNKLTLYGQFLDTKIGNPLSGGVGNNTDYPGIGIFSADNTGSATTLELVNQTPIPASSYISNFYFDFENYGNNGTTIYDAPSGNQIVYTDIDSPTLGTQPDDYYNLTFSGLSTKTVHGSALTVYNSMTSSGGNVDLTTNDPAVTIGGNWTNSATVIEGSGAVTVSGGVTNSGSFNGNGSSATTTISGTLTNSGTITCNSEKFTIGGSVTNSSIITGGAGTITIGGTYTNNSGGAITEGAGTVTIGGNLVNSSGGTFIGNTSSSTTSVSGTLTNSGTITCNSENITITGAATNNSIITGGAGSLTFNNTYTNASGSSIITGAGTATFKGNYTNTSGAFTAGSGSVIYDANYTNSAGSTFTAGSGTVYFSSASAQTLLDNSTNGTVFNNVALNGGSTVTITSGTGNFGVSPTGVLTLSNNSKLVAGTTVMAGGASYLTLNSDATGSATVAAISGTSTITGNVNVERFVTGGATYTSGRWVYRNYRLLSSPVNLGVDGLGNYPWSMNYIAATTIVSDCVSTFSTKTGNPSLYLFNESYTPSNTSYISGNFVGVTNISNLLASGHISTTDATNPTGKVYVGGGAMMFYRGDNINNLAGSPSKTSYPYVTPESAIFNTTGFLNQGTYSVVSWTGYAGLLYTTTNAGNATVRGYNLVGNPYASSIDWSTFSNSVATAPIYGAFVNPTVYVFNPRTNNYDTYTSTTGVITGSGSKILPSGQGFFVQSNNHSSTLTFKETAKTNTGVTGASLLMGTPDAQSAYNSYMRLKLVTDTLDYDDMVIGFHSTSTTAYNPNEDAAYLPGLNVIESLSSTTSDNIQTSVKWLPLPKNEESLVIKLNVNAKVSGLYTLQRTDFKEIPAIYEVWLMDKYKKDSLNIRDNTTYEFNINKTDTATFGSNRFSVVIRENSTLGVHLVNFTATKATNGVQTAWKTDNEQNYTNFTVERSIDGGKTYDVIGSVASSDAGTYSFLDTNPAIGQDLYRLKQEDINDSITYSRPVTIEYANLSNNLVKSSISVYPNPTNSTINLYIPSDANTASTYNITVTTSSGLILKQATSAQPNWQASVSDLLPGTYIIKVLNNKDNTFIGNTKFVKL